MRSGLSWSASETLLPLPVGIHTEKVRDGQMGSEVPRRISWKWSSGEPSTVNCLNLVLESRNFVSIQRNFMDLL